MATLTVSQIKSEYHELLERVVDGCADDGLIYSEEMSNVCRAYLLMRALMKQDKETIAEMMASDHSGQSPGVRILETMMGYRNGSVPTRQVNGSAKSTALIDDRGSYKVVAGELPPPPATMRKVKGPSVETLMDLPRDRYIKIEAGEVKLSSLKLRISQKVNKVTKGTDKPIHLICWEQDDGTIIVRHR